MVSEKNPPYPEDFGATAELYQADYQEYLNRYRNYKRAYYVWVRDNGLDEENGCDC